MTDNEYESKCSYCGVVHNRADIRKCFGKYSDVYTGNYCSARCYTLHYNEKLLKKRNEPNKPIA